jgi:hypothetical protein
MTRSIANSIEIHQTEVTIRATRSWRISTFPVGLERELVLDRDCEFNGDESRTLAAVGAVRIISERDLFDA